MTVLTTFGVLCSLYGGVGFLASRLLQHPLRNNPAIWLTLTFILLPIGISLQSLLWQVSHREILYQSIFCIFMGILWSLCTKKSEKNESKKHKKISGKETVFHLVLLFAFFLCVLIPKMTLLYGQSVEELAVEDDFHKTNVVVSLSYNIASPPFFQAPTQKLSYYYYHFLLPGLATRLTPLTASQAWFLHSMISVALLLSLTFFAARHLFDRSLARTFLLLGVTFLGSGFDFMMYALFSSFIPDHLEWWVRDIAGSTYQISSFYTLFLWVTHHLFAGFMAIIILRLGQSTQKLDRIAVPLLFASMLGYSTFVFIATAFAYIVVSILNSVKTKTIHWEWILLQAGIFLLCSAHILPLFLGRESLLFFDLKILDIFPSSKTPLLASFFSLLSLLVLLIVDIGVVAIPGLLFLVQRNTKHSLFFIHTAIITTLVLTLFWSTKGANDLFMRSIIVCQLCLVLGAALFLDQQKPNKQWHWYGISLICILQLSTFFYETWQRSTYFDPPSEPEYAFIQEYTQKDSIILVQELSKISCSDITFQANRLCALNAKEVDPLALAYTQSIVDEANFHDPKSASQALPEAALYYLAYTPPSDTNLLQLIATTDTFLLYRVGK